MKKLLYLIFSSALSVIMLVSAGCASGSAATVIPGKTDDVYLDGEAGYISDGETGYVPSDKTDDSAGKMTAGAYNDNDYYSDWLALFYKGQGEETSGKFANLGGAELFDLHSLNRVKVTVQNDDGAPVPEAAVACVNGDETLFEAVTDSNGVAYLFPKNDDTITVRVHSGEGTIVKSGEYDAESREATISVGELLQEKTKVIQLMFVIDATGSMGDEMDYLKTELGDVIKRVVEKNTDVKINLAFLFYRDDGDNEKFAYTDFCDVTEESDYVVMKNVLKAQKASGGGDYPEALDEALLSAVNKQWSSGGTKIIFNLLDAPCHRTEQDQSNFANAVKQSASKGIRICPVLASGADAFTEYLTRQAAVLTGGTFSFITDDSGIGGAHHDPELPNTVIERLNDLLVRLIDGYYTGTFAEPVAWKDVK